MSKDTYKKLIKRKAHDYAFNLLCRSKETYKKLNGLNYYEFKIQNYLLSKDYSLEEKTLIFKYRTRMLNLGEIELVESMSYVHFANNIKTVRTIY